MIPALHANDSTGGVTPVEQVDPLISTGGNRYVCGNNPPAATVPFGMVRLGPDTISADGTPALNMSGYYYHDPHIIGFSHTRLCGTGAIDGGHFRVFADRADVPLAERRQQLRASFDHEHESASPGFYSVELPDFQVTAEMTATRRVGLHRYRFAAGQAPRILIDVGSALGRGRSEACEVHVDSENREITGTTRTYGSFSGRYGGLQVYFAAKFRQPWQTCSIWTDSRIDVEGTDAAGNDVCVACTFAEDKTTVELVVALSHVSIENARQNLNGEVAERSFDEIHEAAIVEWNTLLSTVKIDGGTDTDRKIFYTALYHSCMMPTVFSDVNGQYLGFDKQTHQVEDFEYYTDMSLWDTFRTTHPLFTLLTPGRQRDMLVSLVKMAEQGGNLPCWPSGGGYTNSMFGSPADIVIADAWLKGIRGFDVDTAYMMMRKTAMEPAPMGAVYSGREGIADYVKYGYCPSDTMSGAVAHTLEYATTDAAIGQLAAALGKTEDADLFARRGQNYRQLWNPETQYFQPRDTSGKFSTPLMPTLLTYVDIAGKITDDYVEGSALQWRWAVSHDAAGLVSLFSSKEEFVQELSEFFANSSEFVGALPNGYYWHGNQPDIHAVYLFNAAGRPDLTQKWVRWILKHKHGEGPDGLDGNDDGGTLSAWYVFSSLGFYPVVGTDRYELGSPLWKRAVVKMGDKSLEIVTDNYAPEHVYVDHVELNGKSLDRWWVSHAEIADGGTLRFVMSDRVAE
jgi:predicted alpha-1,2-mannosidase